MMRQGSTGAEISARPVFHFRSQNRFQFGRVGKAALAVCLVLAFGIAGCSSKRTLFSGKGSPVYKGSGPIPKGGGRYKVGRPYEIYGKWYSPRENPNYDQVGIASWYGPKFHKRKTANGEWFDMNRMTAAHPTLPLPSFVRVTNLANGRAVVVRVNDRGPYAHNREIDMSRAAARRLGMIRKGTARVRVQYLSRAPLSTHAANYYGQSLDPVMVAARQKPARKRKTNRRIAALDHSAHAQPVYGPARPAARRDAAVAAPLPPQPAAATTGVYVQAASYSNYDNALRAKSSLSALGPVEMSRIDIGARSYFRVRVGPLQTHARAHLTLARVVDAGHRDARIVRR